MKHEIDVLGELGTQFERLASAPKRGRRWSRAWRWRPLGFVFAAVLVAAAAAAAAALVGQRSAPPSATLPVPAGSNPVGADVRRYDIALTPDLSGGAVGWCLSAQLVYSYRGTSSTGTCGAPLKKRPIVAFASGTGSVTSLRDRAPHNFRTVKVTATTTTTLATVTTAQVAAVRFSRSLTILTRADSALPNGYRIAIAIHETVSHNPISRRGAPVSSPLSWIALDRDSHAIPSNLKHTAQAPGYRPSDKAVYWQTQPTHGVGPQPKLHAPPAAACEIYTGTLPGAHPSFGEVVKHVQGFPSLAAKTYLSCAYVWINYRGQGVQAAILLDAQRPGSTPAPLPDTTIVGHNPTMVNEPAGISNGAANYITARRLGDAWFVVESSSPLADRLAALRELKVCVRLMRVGCAAPK